MSNLEKFKTTLEDFDNEVKMLKGISDAFKKIQDLSVTFDNISQEFNNNSKNIEKLNDTVLDSINDLNTLFDKKTDQIVKENKEFYKDLASTVKIQLEDNKSQIKHLIENERTQIKQIFEIEFSKNMSDLKKVIEREVSEQTKIITSNLNSIKITIWVIMGISLIISTGLLIIELRK